jgi:hypothetical protein
VQEPVAWLENLKRLASICPELNMVNYSEEDVDDLNCWAIEVATCIDSITTPPAPVQPVATLFGSLPVYDTTPPAAQRQWVGLTDLQIDMLIHRFGHDPMKLVIELTQELKEENK